MNFQVHQENAADFSYAQAQPQFLENSEFHSKTFLSDKAFALFALIVTFPILLFLALCICIGGQSPIFLQERIGHNGKPFKIFKFRTIPRGGWDVAHTTGVGSIARFQMFVFRQVSKVLRSTGLDELPQFANILMGDMRIIGPRPLVAKDFYALPEGREVRCAVLPGITGLAQINGGQDLDPESKLALDLYVIDHLSFRITAKIVMRTVLRILGFTSATASICSVDLSLAKKHLARRMRLTSVVIAPLASERDRDVTPRPRNEWITASRGAILPTQRSSSRASVGRPVEASADLKAVGATRY